MGVLTEPGQTKHLKRPDNPGPDPDRPGTQKGQLSQRRAQSRSWWKDNSPLADHMRRGGRLWALEEQDQAERIWVGNFKTCSCFWACERICITHSLLMDFPMFPQTALLLLTCSNNESLMFIFFPRSKAVFLVVLPGCWVIQSVSRRSWEQMEYRWFYSCQGNGWVFRNGARDARADGGQKRTRSGWSTQNSVWKHHTSKYLQEANGLSSFVAFWMYKLSLICSQILRNGTSDQFMLIIGFKFNRSANKSIAFLIFCLFLPIW